MSEAAKPVSKSDRPEFRNIHITQLSNYRLPLAGWVSILHRVSGMFLFLLLPFILFLLDKSLTSEISFMHFKGLTSGWCAKLVILALCWAYLHHFCAGLRHLMMDNHMGLSKDCARKSAAKVLVVSVLLTVLVGLKLFGVF